MDLKSKSIINVAETYRKMYEEEEKPVYTAHHFTVNSGLYHFKKKFNSAEDAHEQSDGHGQYRSDTDQDHLGHIIVKHHKGQVTAVKTHFPGDVGEHKHMVAGIAKDAEEKAKKLNVSKMTTAKRNEDGYFDDN
jgi:hypothetical protein